MGLYYNKNAEWELIHSAYGTELKGKRGTWVSPFYGEQDVYTDISVNGKELCLGNHAIFVTGDSSVINMEADKDLLCYMFSHREKEMDNYEFERFFTKEYFGCLWRSKALNWKQKEIQEKANKEATEKRENKRKATIAEFQKYADKKKLRLIIEYDKAYFIKIDKKKHKDSDAAADDLVLMFAREYPGNGIEIVEEMEIA